MDAGVETEVKKSPEKKGISNFFVEIYNVFRFIGNFFKAAFVPPFEFKEISRQCYEIGVRSLPIITLTAFITGIVFTKQSRPSLAEFGATSWLPSLVSIAIVRALAPLVTALIVTGKVGSNIGAELGSMKVTEQIDAMEVSSTNPFNFLVVTRVSAMTWMLPLLMCYFGFVALMGAYLNIHQNEQTSFIAFIENAFKDVSFLDLFASFFKALVYGFTIAVVGCYMGFKAEQGTVGVGKAANSSVVVSMFLIFIEELIIVQAISYLR